MSLELKTPRNANDEVIFLRTDANTEKVRSVITDDGKSYPAEKKDDGIIVVADTVSNKSKNIKLSEIQLNDGVQIKYGENKKNLDIYINGKLFSKYIFDGIYPKPFLGPIYTSAGTSYTRDDLHAEEHPHQRSLFIGVGDVNGIDFWNENPEHLGYVRHKYFEKIENGPAYGTFTACNVWQDMKENPVLDEKRTFTFYNQKEKCRYIDVEINFTAAYKDVVFGTTKEAGPMGIRINEEMRADRTGSFVNSYGAENEKECWGRAASWCDYKGFIKNVKYGIAVFDNESNERYPTTWHIRNYGLFAPNNLYFKGALKIPKAYSLTYKYRICFYEGEENIQNRFLNYVK